MIRALIFDYFDVVRIAGNGLRSAYRRLGGDVTADEPFLANITSAANFGFVQDIDEQIAEKLGVSVETWRQELSGAKGNDPDMLAYIKALRGRGYKTGLLSNAPSHSLQTFFAPGEIAQYFNVALASGDTGFIKPEAAFYRLMAERLHVAPEECVMIDDRLEYCKGAEYIGMKAVHYRHFDQFKTELEKLLDERR